MAQPCLGEANPSLPPPPPPPSVAQHQKRAYYSTHPVHKTLASAANLANLLPTGTVLAFQTLTPSFANMGSCELSNKCLTACLMGFCGLACFFSSFTDSFIDSSNGKLYYGIATFRGLYIFNSDYGDASLEIDDQDSINKELRKYRIRRIDFVHAFLSLFVFIVFAISDSDVQSCYFDHPGANLNALVMNLPLGVGVFSSFVFMVFPTTRMGIGYADMRTTSN